MAAFILVVAVLAAYLAVAGDTSGPASLAGLGAVLALALYALALWRWLAPQARAALRHR